MSERYRTTVSYPEDVQAILARVKREAEDQGLKYSLSVFFQKLVRDYNHQSQRRP